MSQDEIHLREVMRAKINEILDSLNYNELDLVYDYCNNLEYP